MVGEANIDTFQGIYENWTFITYFNICMKSVM